MDPLVKTIRFVLPQRDEHGDRDWVSRVRQGSFPLELCEFGPRQYFQVPRDCRELRVVISPYPHKDSYLIEEDYAPIIRSKAGSRQSAHSTSFYTPLSDLIRDILDDHPNFNFYFAIEVRNHGKSNRRSGSWVRAARLLHATGSRSS